MTRSQDTGRDEERVLLPRKMDPETRRVLDGVGLIWEGERPVDFLTVQWWAQLPKGWRQVFVGEGPRRSCYLVDQKGQRRVSVDTNRHSDNAAIRAINRFSVVGQGAYTKDRSAVFGQVMDRSGVPTPEDWNSLGQVIHTTEDVPTKTAYSATGDEEMAARKLAEEWLDQNYPDWRNPAAYWD